MNAEKEGDLFMRTNLYDFLSEIKSFHVTSQKLRKNGDNSVGHENLRRLTNAVIERGEVLIYRTGWRNDSFVTIL
jgi:hypothetical protein